MKKFIFMAFTVLCLLSCQDGLWNAINELKDEYSELEKRVARLEELCKEMNTNISSLQTIVNVLLSNDYITGITPITKDGKEIGYVITFGKHDPITIYHGTDGKDGKDGTGSGSVPVIGVAQDTDGVYYWTLNGEWLLDANNNKIRVTGQDGQNGTNGTDGITPQLKIENDYWYVSYDNGVTWTQLGKAKGDDGSGGTSGDSMFQSVTYDDDYVYFTLVNGTTLTVRKANSDFDQTLIDNVVTSLTLDKEEIWFTAYEQTETIIGTTTPFPNSTIHWVSADTSVVTVVGGVVTSHGPGRTSLTARAGDKSATVKVYVGLGNPKAFSVSPLKQVYFSPGDLVYIPQNTHHCADGKTKKGTWRFIDDQLTHFGHSYLQFHYSSSYKSYNIYYKDTTLSCDNFLLGSSGYKYPTIPQSPTIASAVYDQIYMQDITGTYYDWGLYNAIENGGDIPGVYRTPSFNEWQYLLEQRTNADDLKQSITIEGTQYLVLFPDYWQYIGQEVPNTISKNEWQELEYIGAIALLYSQTYWSTSYYGQNSSTHEYLYYGVSQGSVGGFISIYDSDCAQNTSYSSQCGVRLIKDVE